jgi:putative membrane protein
MVYTCFGNWFLGGYWNMVFMILFWIIAIVIIVWLVKEKKFFNLVKDNDTKNPLEIIKERYAKGEINKKQYEQMKKELMR